jgi:hypothetical protein
MVLRMDEPSTTTTAAVQQENPKISVNPPAQIDASLRKDLLDKPDTGQEIGKRNIFEYRREPPPPPPGPPRGSRVNPPFQSTGGSVPVNTPPLTPQPPLPPQIPLKYVGYLTLDAPGGGFTAVLSDDTRHYNVTAGEVLMGRYRVLTISDKIVDVEDLEYKRRQSLPIVK